MEMTLKKVKKTLHRLDELQASHIRAFETQTLPNLEKQMAERETGFSELKKNLTLFLLKADPITSAEDKSMIQDIKALILSLMHQNTSLKSKIETHKNSLKNSLKTITNGRQMIHAYGSSVSQRNRPRVINFEK